MGDDWAEVDLGRTFRNMEPGVSDEWLRHLEREIGRELPPPLRGLWRRISAGRFLRRALWIAGREMPLAGLIPVNDAPRAPGRPAGYLARYRALVPDSVPARLFPFARDGFGDLYAVAFPDGVVHWSMHEGEISPKEFVVASTLREFIECAGGPP